MEKLTKKELWKVFLHQLTIRGANNYERQQNAGFTEAMMPVIEKYYEDPEAKKEAYARHMEYFLTNDITSAIPVGVAAAMEERYATEGDIDPDSINAVKTALMGPLAGLGDSLLNGTARPILAGLAISFITSGLGWFGPIFFIFGMALVSLGVRYLGVFQGYKQGEAIRLKKILIFAGTTEGRKLSEYLAEAEINHTICVATEYGEIVLRQHPFVKVHQGRMNQEQIERFLSNGKFDVVVDATHPFAKEITYNIQAALKEMGQIGISIPYLRLKRDGITERENGITYFETNEECVKALEDTEGNILLTTGSKELYKYCVSEGIKHRLYVRILPSVESLSLCTEQGICGKQVIAMQGPFTTEMNEAIIRQYEIAYLVTKESGVPGGYQEKLNAAKRTGTKIFVIGCPKEGEGYSFSEICQKLEDMGGEKFRAKNQIKENMEIFLAGIGMGHVNGLTKEVERVISEADILLGAERMLNTVCSKAEKHPFYQAEQIIPYLHDIQSESLYMKNIKVLILFSGDSGFYSGCQSLYAALEKEITEGHIKASLRILPGISSVAYLASCIGESYQDAAVYSIHGKKICNLVRRIKSSPKTFLITSGVKDINQLGELLIDAGMQKMRNHNWVSVIL